MNRLRLVPLLSGVLAVGSAAFVLIGVGGLWIVLIATPLLAFGCVSIKTAFQGSEKEIVELTDNATTLSEETKQNLGDRL